MNRKRKKTVAKKNEKPLLTWDDETGEIDDFRLKSGERMTIVQETGEWVLTFEEYVSSDAFIEQHLYNILSAVDYQRFKLMACWLNTPFNIVEVRNHRPHTLDTLSEAFKLNVDDTRKCINRLVANGLADWSIRPESGHDKKIIMLNPFVVRKRKTVNDLLVQIFPDFEDVIKEIKRPKNRSIKSQAPVMKVSTDSTDVAAA